MEKRGTPLWGGVGGEQLTAFSNFVCYQQFSKKFPAPKMQEIDPLPAVAKNSSGGDSDLVVRRCPLQCGSAPTAIDESAILKALRAFLPSTTLRFNVPFCSHRISQSLSEVVCGACDWLRGWTNRCLLFLGFNVPFSLLPSGVCPRLRCRAGWSPSLCSPGCPAARPIAAPSLPWATSGALPKPWPD